MGLCKEIDNFTSGQTYQGLVKNEKVTHLQG